jgi:hypothetical protein
VDRRNKAGCTVPVLGALLVREAEATTLTTTSTTTRSSTVLAVGNSAMRHVDSSEMIPVVCCQSNVWDGIDQTYVHSLEAKQVLSTKLPRLFAVNTEKESEVESNDKKILIQIFYTHGQEHQIIIALEAL